MFTTIETHQHADNRHLLDAMFRLRKRVFADELEWDVAVDGAWERDRYDDHNPVYLVWCSDDRRRLYASLRLMPTTGPTLLHDVFRRTFGGKVDLSAPGVWEATRMCVDAEAMRRDLPEIDPVRAMAVMVALICEVAVDKGIHTVVSNYEPHVARIYRRAGAVFDEIGRADGYGSRPVCCGLFEASPRVLKGMYAKLGVAAPLRRTAEPVLVPDTPLPAVLNGLRDASHGRFTGAAA